MKTVIAPAVLAGLAAVSTAQVSYVGGVYSQSFDTLPDTGYSSTVTGRGPHALNGAFGISGLDGWQGANFGGSSSNTEFRSHNGGLSGSAGRGVLSLGTDGSGERALGTLATSNQISTFGAVFTNDTGTTLTQFTLSYVGEQWRRGNVGAPNSLFFSYGLASGLQDATLTPDTDLTFVAPNTQASPTEVALDGNAAGNFTSLSKTITDLNWLPGTTLVVQWAGQDQTGQDDGLAIDSVRFSAAVPAPGATLALIAGLGLAARRRR